MKKYILCNTNFDRTKTKEQIEYINYITKKTCSSINHIIKNIDKYNTEKEIENEIKNYMKGYEIAFPTY